MVILKGMNGINGHQEGWVSITGGEDNGRFSSSSWAAFSGERPRARIPAWIMDGSLWMSLLSCIRQLAVDPSENRGGLRSSTIIVPGMGV